MVELSIAADIVFRLIEILHELAGQDRGLERENTDEDGDDASIEGLVGGPGDARLGEIASLLHDLNDDERTDLVALGLLGRGAFDLSDWEGAIAAAEEQLGNGSLREVADLLTGDEAESEFLEAGLDAFGHNFAEWDAETIGSRPEDNEDGGPGDVADDAQRQLPGRVHTR